MRHTPPFRTGGGSIATTASNLPRKPLVLRFRQPFAGVPRGRGPQRVLLECFGPSGLECSKSVPRSLFLGCLGALEVPKSTPQSTFRALSTNPLPYAFKKQNFMLVKMLNRMALEVYERNIAISLKQYEADNTTKLAHNFTTSSEDRP